MPPANTADNFHWGFAAESSYDIADFNYGTALEKMVAIAS